MLREKLIKGYLLNKIYLILIKMKNIIKLSALSIILFFSSCTKDDNIIEPSVNDDINYFVWKGLNAYYLWQKDIPNLADNRFANFDELYTYFRGFSNPENSFESLLNRPTDRFSWIVDDYIALENSFSGISETTVSSKGKMLSVLFCQSKLIHPSFDEPKIVTKSN